MISHYFKSTFRNLWKNKVFTGINILGLAVSFSVAAVIYLIVNYHFSFDNFHKDKDRIFRVTTTSYFVDDEFPNSGSPVPLSEVLASDLPGIEYSVFFHTFWSREATINFGDNDRKVFYEGNSNRIFTDSEYFNMLQYKWLAGSKESLNEPFNVVLTEELAKKYFGEKSHEDILGKEIIYDNSPPLEVSGIVKSFDRPSEFIFEAFISLPTLDDPHFNFYKDWYGVNSNDQLFVNLGRNISPQSIEDQISGIEKKYVNIDKSGKRTYELQPIEDIHFNRKYSNYKPPGGHKPTLYALIIITIFLLVLGCINFINLTTALTSARTKELGVRKTLGSRKIQLTFQMMIETLIVVLAASMVSLILLPLVFRVFSDFIPGEVSPSEILEWKNLMVFFVLILLVAIVAGIFPVSSISKYQKPGLLQTYFMNEKSKKQRGYRALMVLQFSISILIITATLSVQKQLLFSIRKDLGYQTKAIITFSALEAKKEVLFNTIRAIPEVQSVSLGGPPPASGTTLSSTYDFEYGDHKTEIHADIKHADSSFINLYEIELLAGRNVESSDSLECLVNKTFLKKVAISEPAQILGYYAGKAKIVGVVEDFHMKSTYMLIKPVVILSQKENFNTFHVKLYKENPSSWGEAIKQIETAWNEIFRENNFRYQFYDEQIAAFYDKDKSIVKLLVWVSGLTTFISCLGLLGMAIFSLNQRVKEIGIRKVNGAKVWEVMAMLNKDFVKWVIVAFILATPIAWYAMNKYLENFAYKTELSWWIFALAGLLALGIALLTVSWQSWKAATRNPVEALRYE